MDVELSIVTPCWNEEEGILQCVRRVHETLSAVDTSFEHIFIDNASQDSTVEKLLSVRETYPHIRILVNDFNIGAFRSIQRGIGAAEGRLIVPFLAADCQDPPELIAEMISNYRSGKYDSIAGVRQYRRENFFLTVMRKLFYRILSVATRGKSIPGASEFRLMKTESASRLIDINESTPFLRVHMAQIQGRTMYLPYAMEERSSGKSSVRLFPLVDDALSGLMTAMPSIFSRILVVTTLMTALATLSMPVVAFLTLFHTLDGFVTLITVGATAYLILVDLVLIVGHYTFQVFSQTRSSPLSVTREL